MHLKMHLQMHSQKLSRNRKRPQVLSGLMRFEAPRFVFLFLFYFVVCWVVVVLLRARALAAAFPRGVLSCGGLWPPLGAGAPGLPFCWGGRRCRCWLACCGRAVGRCLLLLLLCYLNLSASLALCDPAGFHGSEKHMIWSILGGSWRNLNFEPQIPVHSQITKQVSFQLRFMRSGALQTRWAKR